MVDGIVGGNTTLNILPPPPPPPLEAGRVGEPPPPPPPPLDGGVEGAGDVWLAMFIVIGVEVALLPEVSSATASIVYEPAPLEEASQIIEYGEAVTVVFRFSPFSLN